MRRKQPAPLVPGGGRPVGGASAGRSKVSYVPAATHFNSGMSARRGCDARCEFHSWKSITRNRQLKYLPCDNSGAQRSESAYRRSAKKRGDRLERRLLASSPGGGRHSGPQGRGGSDPTCAMAPLSARTPKDQDGARQRPAGLRNRVKAERKSAGTAWNADLRSAQRPAGPRNRAKADSKKRGDGLERRPLAGTAARRAAAVQTPPVRWLPSRRGPPKTRMARDSGPPPGELATGLRPASRGSAKPAPMTLRHANVRATTFQSRRGVCSLLPLPRPHRHRLPEAGATRDAYRPDGVESDVPRRGGTRQKISSGFTDGSSIDPNSSSSGTSPDRTSRSVGDRSASPGTGRISSRQVATSSVASSDSGGVRLG